MPSLLMIINFFPPSAGGGVYRPLSFVRDLSNRGWDITVVTPQAGEFWITDEALLKKIPEKVRVARTMSLSGQRVMNALRSGRSGPSRRSSSGFGLVRALSDFFLIPDSYVGWLPFARNAAFKLVKQGHFDALYSTSPPDSSHLIANSVAKRFHLPWVADFRDPWINLYLKKPPTPIHACLHRHFERTVTKADAILVTTDWHEEILERLYPGARVVKITNGYDEDDFVGTEQMSPSGDVLTILHCGMLTLGRSSRPFLEGLAAFLSDTPDALGRIKVSFVGARESDNEYWVERFSLEDVVSFEDNVPHEECIRREAVSHVLLLIKHDTPNYNGLVPGKLYEYIGARRPILAVVPEGEAARIVLNTGRGEVADISKTRQIAEKLGVMFKLFMDGRLDASYNLSKIDDFSRRVQSAKLDELLKAMVGDNESKA